MRRTASLAVAYALVLQAFFGAVVATQAAPFAADSTGMLVLCLPSGDTSAPLQNGPAGHSPTECCLICTLTMGAGAPPPAAAAVPPAPMGDLATATLSAVQTSAGSIARIRSGLTRAPPVA